MLKAILISTLIIASLASYNFDLQDVANIQEEDIQVLYELYLQYLAPRDLTVNSERYTYFRNQVLEIVAHNNDATNTWKRGVTQYTGMTIEELEGVIIMAPQNCSATTDPADRVEPEFLARKLPAFLDWREKGVVSPVKNQGRCGSCWTFSSTGALEANHAIQHRAKPADYSEQQLVDCAQDFDNNGCRGGLPSHAFEYLRYSGGIESQKDYPYTAVDGECKFDRSKVIATVPYGSRNITLGDEQELKMRLATVGPVSVAYQVTKDFGDYKGGIYVGKTCKNGTQDVNHAVLAVGYGTDEATKMDYWIVKNSWGTKFGVEGYFKIQRGVNMCGIAVCASYPRLNLRM